MAVNLERVRSLIAEAAEASGYELVDVELRGAGQQRVLRIFIDRESGISHSGISHEDCERVSREVSTLLDVEDPIPFSYVLEVSSPGLDRKLSRPEDFARFEGRRVRIRTRTPVGNRKSFRGRIGGFASGRIQLELDTGEPVEIPLDVVHETRLEVDWKSELHAARSR